MPALEILWNSLDRQAAGPSFLRVDELHPLDIYVGKDVLGERLLLVVTNEEPPAPGHYRALHVSKGPRQDGRWALTVKLVQPELERIFAHLCQDLVDSSVKEYARRSVSAFVISQLDKWQRLMARGRDGLLDESQVRGLFAELSYLEQFAIPFRGVAGALEGWVGPLEADQDFRLGDRVVEVKSCGPGGGGVSISSADQLDDPGVPLFLVAVLLEGGKFVGSNAESLNELVRRIRETLTGNMEAAVVFDDRLRSAGYAVKPDYDKSVYSVLQTRHFRVAGDFPRIVSSRLTAGVSRVRYELSLAACAPFEEASSVGA